MSVLKSKRTESKAEYVNVANAIYIETINFRPAFPQGIPD